MIAKASNISSFQACMRYVVNKQAVSADGEKRPAAEFICSNLSSVDLQDPILMANELDLYRTKRGLKQPGKHFSLSIAPGESLYPEQWATCVNTFLQEMGYGECKYAAYTHNDADHSHIHIIVNRAKPSGVAVKDGNERFKSMVIMRALEKRYGLKSPENSPRESRITRAEKKVIERLGSSDKEVIRAALDYAYDMAIEPKDFVHHAAELDVKVNFRRNEKNEITGVSYDYLGDHYAGYKLGKKYTSLTLVKWAREKIRERKQAEEKAQKVREMQKAIKNKPRDPGGKRSLGM